MVKTNFDAPIYEVPDDDLLERVNSAAVEGSENLIAVGYLTLQGKAIVRVEEVPKTGSSQPGEVLAEIRSIPHGILGEVINDPRSVMKEDDIARVLGGEQIDLHEAA